LSLFMDLKLNTTIQNEQNFKLIFEFSPCPFVYENSPGHTSFVDF
jgi:hypothetical protein